MRYWLFTPFFFMLIGCYEPKEGCLDIEAINYDVSGDDPCPDCCKYPALLLAMQHHVVLPAEPDTSYSLKYATKYQSPFDTNDFFFIDRARFFISDLKFVRDDGLEVGVLDSFWLPLVTGDSVYLENNFAKLDRDIFQAATIGTVKTNGLFVGLKFTVGLSEQVQQAKVDTLPTGHPLALEFDKMSYRSDYGIIPTRLIFRPDTLPNTQPIDFRFFEPKQISLDFSQPVPIDRGFNIRLTLRMNYSRLFELVDFKNDSPAEMQSKIDSQLTKVFSVTALLLE